MIKTPHILTGLVQRSRSFFQGGISTKKKINIIYNDRNWINDETSSFTGSVVCHLSLKEHTTPKINEQYYLDGFVEFADCGKKLRIHTNYEGDTTEILSKYKIKINKIKDILERYTVAIDDALEEVNASNKTVNDQTFKWNG